MPPTLLFFGEDGVWFDDRIRMHQKLMQIGEAPIKHDGVHADTIDFMVEA